MKISYAIPVCNEIVEIQRIVDYLVKHKSEQDEIVIQYDSDNGTKAVEEWLRAKSVNRPRFTWHSFGLDNDFGAFKSRLNELCSGDWIFQLDADEYPDEYLMQTLPHIIEANPDVEAYWVPRCNTVQGLTQRHINLWGWTLDSKGRVNYPDYQMRLYKNKPEIMWEGVVHEQLTGYDKFAHLPANEDFCIYHPKEIERQEKQNAFYSKL